MMATALMVLHAGRSFDKLRTNRVLLELLESGNGWHHTKHS